MERKILMKLETWKLRDVIMMALLGVVFAILYLAVFYLGLSLSTALTPLGFADFGFELIYGVWFMASTLAAYIIRKPGVALITEVLASVVELLLGNSGGMTVVLTGLIQGLGAELVFAAFRYKKWDLTSLTLAAFASAVFIYIYELYYLQYYMLTIPMQLAHIAIRFVSAFLFSALIVKLAGDGLAKTGVVKSYALGANVKAATVYDDEEEEKA